MSKTKQNARRHQQQAVLHGFLFGSLSLVLSTLLWADERIENSTDNLNQSIQNKPTPNLNDNKAVSGNAPIAAIQKFVQVMQGVQQNYVAALSADQLFEDAMAGMVDRLDPYSEYLDEKKLNTIMQFTDGDIAHIGIELKKIDGLWRVVAVLSGSSSSKLGISTNTIVQKIDGKNIKDLEQNDVEQMLRGVAGSTVRLTIGDKQKKELYVLRTTLERNLTTVDFNAKTGIAVVTCKGMQATTGVTILNGLQPLLDHNLLKGVVLDLRDNPGGLLASAVEIAGYFLDAGVIVSSRGQNQPERIYQTLTPQRFSNVPVAVVVNGFTASAAEVLAAALQDRARASVVGQTSYGKGSIQKLWRIDKNTALKLTVAYYYTPNNHLIDGLGVVPNYVIAKDIPKTVEVFGRSNTPVNIELSTNKDYSLNKAISLLVHPTE